MSGTQGLLCTHARTHTYTTHTSAELHSQLKDNKINKNVIFHSGLHLNQVCKYTTLVVFCCCLF